MRRIRNSAKALIIIDGKMAAIKIRDAGEEWYIMPGGGQEAEETLNEAVCREVSEELGIAIECKELLFVVEGVHGETLCCSSWRYESSRHRMAGYFYA